MELPTEDEVMGIISTVTDTTKFRILEINEKIINVKYDELKSKTDMKMIEDIRQALIKKFKKNILIVINPQ